MPPSELLSMRYNGGCPRSRNGYDPGLRQIPLGNAIGTAFDCAPLHSDCHTELRKFVSISREGENWRLVIRTAGKWK